MASVAHASAAASAAAAPPPSPPIGWWDWGMRLAASEGVRMGANHLPNLFRPDERIIQLRKQVKALNKNDLLSDTARTVAHFTSQWLQDKTQKPPKPVKADPRFTDLFHPESNPVWGPLLQNLLKKHEKLIQQTIELNIVKALARISEALAKKQADPKFMTQLCIKWLKTASQHFRKFEEMTEKSKEFNDVTNHEKNKISPADKARFDDEMRKKFSTDPEYPNIGVEDINKDSGAEYRANHFYLELAKELIALAFPNGEKDVEFPDMQKLISDFRIAFPLRFFNGVNDTFEMMKGLKARLWNQLPAILAGRLVGMNALVLSQHSINSMLLSALEQIRPPSSPVPKEEPFVVPNDDLQKELEKICGVLGKQLLKLFPKTFVGNVVKLPFVKSKLKDGVGEFLAPMIRKVMTKWNLSTGIDQGIENGIPKWLKCVCKDGAIVPTGRGYEFPDSDPAERKKIEEETEKQLKAKLSEFLSHSTAEVAYYLLALLFRAIPWFIGSSLKLLSLGLIAPAFYWRQTFAIIDEGMEMTFVRPTVRVVKGIWHATGLGKRWELHLEQQRNRVLNITHWGIHEALLCNLVKTTFKELKA